MKEYIMLSHLFNRCINDSIKNNPHAYAQAKNIVGAAIIAAIAAPIYAVIYFLLNYKLGSFVILAEGTFIVSTMLILKLTGSLFWTRELIIGSLTACIMWISYNLGGIDSPMAYWLILPPLAAFFCGGIATGMFYGLLCTIAIFLMYFLNYTDFVYPSSPVTDSLLLQTVSMLGLLIIILLLAYFFEKMMVELRVQVLEEKIKTERACKKQEDLRYELVGKLSELEDQKSQLKKARRMLKK